MRRINSPKVIFVAISIVLLSLVVAQPAKAGKISIQPSCSVTLSGVFQSGNQVTVPLNLNAGTVPGGTAYVDAIFNVTWNDTTQTSGSWQVRFTKPNWGGTWSPEILYIGDPLTVGSEIWSSYASFFYYGKSGRQINSQNVGCTYPS
jgi:hypothetical protein